MPKKNLRGPLGREMAKLRIDRDEQLIDMARRIGLTPSTLRNYEYGKTSPGKNFFESLQAHYGVDLFRYYDESKALRQVIRLNTLDPETRNRIVAILQSREVSD